MNGKYASLSRYLHDLPPNTREDTLRFADIESLLGRSLPPSALQYPAWWANQSNLANRPQAKAWMSAGFEVDGFRMGVGGWVRFKRTGPSSAVSVNPNSPVIAVRSPSTHAAPASLMPVAYAPGTVALVSCVATKLTGKHTARDLYVSPWFKKVRGHVERAGLAWYVLSAKYGLVAPDQEIESYEMTLNTMSVRSRREWAHRVADQIATLLQEPHAFALFAGARYREFLEPLLAARGAEIQVPMEKLTLGRQLNWLDRQLPRVPA